MLFEVLVDALAQDAICGLAQGRTLMTSPSASRVQQLYGQNLGQGPRLPFNCPQCAHTGWVDWKNLNRALRCPKCDCHFLVDRDGQVRSFADADQVHFTCVRCGKSGQFPATLVERGAQCPSCKLPLSFGSDNGPRVNEESQKAKRGAVPAHRGTIDPALPTPLGRKQRLLLKGGCIAVLIVAAVACGLLLQAYGRAESVEEMAAAFTQYCLAGKRDRAVEFIADDVVQRMEFERWFLRHFASIQASHRPKGDRAQVAAELAEEHHDDPHQSALQLTMSSSFIGQREHRQIWRQQDAKWSFDPVATLAEQDKPGKRR